MVISYLFIYFMFVSPVALSLLLEIMFLFSGPLFYILFYQILGLLGINGIKLIVFRVR